MFLRKQIIYNDSPVSMTPEKHLGSCVSSVSLIPIKNFFLVYKAGPISRHSKVTPWKAYTPYPPPPSLPLYLCVDRHMWITHYLGKWTIYFNIMPKKILLRQHDKMPWGPADKNMFEFLIMSGLIQLKNNYQNVFHKKLHLMNNDVCLFPFPSPPPMPISQASVKTK